MNNSHGIKVIDYAHHESHIVTYHVPKVYVGKGGPSIHERLVKVCSTGYLHSLRDTVKNKKSKEIIKQELGRRVIETMKHPTRTTSMTSSMTSTTMTSTSTQPPPEYPPWDEI